MKLPRFVRKLFRKRGSPQTVHPDAADAPKKSPWNRKFKIASQLEGALGYLDGLDERGRPVGWMEISRGVGNRLTFCVDDAQAVVRADVLRNDVIEAGYSSGRGFVFEVLALAPLAKGLLEGSPLRIMDAQGEALCEPLRWTALTAEDRNRVLFAWLIECFRSMLEGDLETREAATSFSLLVCHQPEMGASGQNYPDMIGASLRGMQDLCAGNLNSDAGFEDNLRALRELCVQLGQVNPKWKNAAAGFEVALLVEEFLRLLRREWRQKSQTPLSLSIEAPATREADGKRAEVFMSPPLYPDRFHHIPWDGWVRKALERAFLFAADLARNDPPSSSLVELALNLGSATALLYRDDQLTVATQRFIRLCGTTDVHQIEIEARALKRLGRFTEAHALEKSYGIDTLEIAYAQIASFTTALGVALEIHQALDASEVRAWRQRLEASGADAAGDESLQRTLSEYLAFCSRVLMNPRSVGANSLKKVWQLRKELIHAIRELLHLVSPHRERGSTTELAVSGKRVLVVGSSDLPQVRLYRQIQKIDALRALQPTMDGLDVVHVDTWQQIDSPKMTQLLAGTALLVICRLPATLAFLRLVHAARGARIPILYDIDDLLFDADNFPPSYATYAGGISRRDHRRLAEDTVLWLEAMRSADSVVVSTTTLARRAEELLDGQKPILIEPNHAPALLLEQAATTVAKSFAHKSDVHLVYGTGTLAHKQILLEWIFPALEALLGAHETLQISLVGRLEEVPGVLSSHPRVRVVPFGSYADYLSILASADTSLAPLEPGIATDSKSALKWMEAAMLGAACVVSPTATYREILEAEVDVLFAEDPGEWRRQLGRLIEGHHFRRRMAKAASSKAKKLAGPAHARDFWRARLTDIPVFGMRDQAAQSKRLLVVNLYFWPQAAGGATRVVEDQVSGLLRQYPGQYEVTVLCADKFSGDLGVDFSAWGEGVRIVRLHTPGKAWSGWLDSEVEEFMRAWLRAETFDLVHVHAIQVLTTSLLKPVREAGIPYVVTLHDAWWLCEHQFLTRAYGDSVDPANWMDDVEIAEGILGVASAKEHLERRRALEQCLDALYVNAKSAEASSRAGRAAMRLTRKLPSLETLADERRALDKRLESLVADQANRVRLYSSFSRRRELSEYLSAASTVFAVSQPFAELYARALENSPSAPPAIEVLANEWQSYPCNGVRRQEGPIHCAFIGGWSVHKGAAVLKEAMARVKARNLQLTVVDYGLSKGEERALDWGGIDVRFTGPRPIAEMADFYRSMDILLAPSIWPESFGLVTREALSAGVWVIATAVGALAEPIEPGVNGSVIPARDSAALAEAIDFAASPDGAAARAGWRVQAGIWLKELPRTDNIATLHKRYGELIYVQ